ncbi:MAG: choice-of-anchor I family protein [Saprospiraceae bacterium]|nr:choice-of-anchor I family protein [Saprospiraceae bacterium]
MKQSIYKFFLLCLIWGALYGSSSAQQTLTQGFERTAADNFSFVATPLPYNDVPNEDQWVDTTVVPAIAPASGDRFWYMRDLENTGGGGAFFHTLDFGPVDVSAFSDNTLTFKYYTEGYEAADSLGYIVAFDNGTTWNPASYVDLNRNTLAWTTVTINAPANTQFVRLRLMAKQNGGSDYAGWDDVQLFSSNGDVIPPVALGASVTGANTLQLYFNEALGASAENVANYTGIADLANAVRNAGGDTVTLTFNTPFAQGEANTLTASGVSDLAGNALASPFVYSFIYNSTTPALVITEINYNPPSSDPDTLEFIEFYNAGSTTAILGGLQLSGVVQMTFPAGLTLAPGEVFLVAANKAACETFFPGLTFYQWASGVLTNGGNTILLSNSTGSQIDLVVYDDAFPWPLEPDGNGPSLELLSPNLDNNDGANWLASTTPTSNAAVFASPGVVNVAALPTISFVTTRSRVEENGGTVTIPVKVDNLNVPLAEAKIRAVQYSTAVAGEDYVLLDTFVAFPAGATTPFDVKVQIVDDNTPRDSRYLILQLSDFTAASAGANTEFVVLINDDDTEVPKTPANATVSMRHLTSFDVDPTTDATAEITAFDPVSKRLFTTNIAQNRLEIIDFKNPYALSKFASIDLTPYGGGINSVAYANGTVAVAIDATPTTDPGQVVFFDVDGNYINAVTVGSLPDHVNFTSDGRTLLVANEGEPADDYSVDPNGSISIIDLTAGAAALTQAEVTNLDFVQFNADSAALAASGVRIFGPNATVAQDFEPEYITVSTDGLTAWVTLQENNALAVVDIQNKLITQILPLGAKNYAAQNVALDASDQAPGIFFNSWNVNGIYQPDAIAYWEQAGVGYLMTANEGDVREWDAYEEIVRLGASSYVLDPVAFPDAAYLKRSELLGRLNVTTANGDTDGDGDYDEIYTFGGRSVSIWNASTGALVWDSGDDFERITAADPVYGGMFNASNSNNTRKNRSDDKGPEPEGVALGTIDGRNYAFTALERIGGVMVYDVTDPQAPEFIQWINTRATGTAAGGDLGPEGILFVPKDQSPNKRNLIVVSNEISGTLSVFEIQIDRTKNGEYDLTKYAFDDTPAIGFYGDTIKEGGISGLMYRDGSYRFVGDRGPNADALNDPQAMGATALVFPFPDYAPKVWQVRPENGELVVEDFDFIKRPDGSGASGLPLPIGQGNTGEVAWSDTNATVLPNDAWGIDSEGLTQDNEGNFWVCDEYGTSIWKLDAQFRVIQRFTPFPVEAEDMPLDSLLGKRRANRGLEGIAYTPNGKVFAILQSPANNPDATTGNNSRIHRLLELDPATGAMRTFVYVHDPALGDIRSRDWKIGDLTAVNNEEFLVLEHAERNGWNAKNIYKFNINGATPVTGNDFGGKTLEQLIDPAGLAANAIVPVQKEFFADLLELGWELQHDKPEGLTIVDEQTIAVINDNDFGIASPNADGNIVLTGKTTRLYVYGLPNDKQLDYVSPYCTVALGNDLEACEGETVTLTPQGDFAQFTWNDGSTTATLAVTESGDYSLVAENAVGCRLRDTLAVTFNALPEVDLGPDGSACVGETFQLDAQNPGAAYTWSTGASTQMVLVSQTADYAVVVTNAQGCSASDTINVVFNALPVVNLGPNQGLCTGAVVTLDAGNAGAEFLWSSGETSQAVVINAAGTYSVVVTNEFGCTANDAIVVSNLVTPNVDLGSDVQRCAGQSVVLNNDYPGAATLWNTGATTPSITVTESGVYSVQVTLLTGCSDVDSIQITFNPLPVVELLADTTICEGDTLLLDAGNAGAAYSWNNGATTQTLEVGTTDLYVVTVTNSFGCSAEGDVAVNVQVCIGTEEVAAINTARIYPNPNNGMFTVELSELPAQYVHLRILNAVGQIVYTQTQLTTLQTAIDLGSMPKGLYFVQLNSDGQTVSYRVIVQ